MRKEARLEPQSSLASSLPFHLLLCWAVLGGRTYLHFGAGPLTLQLIAEELEEAGFATLRLSEAAGSLVVIKENRPDLLVLDTSLETQEIGWRLLESVRSDRDLSAMPVIVCASDPSLIQTRSPLLRRPPETSVFLKPFNPEALLKMIRATLHPGQ